MKSNRIIPTSSSQIFAGFFLTALLVAIDFVPAFGGVDVMGAQWLYLSIINGLTITYLHFTHQKEIKYFIDVELTKGVSILFSLFIILAGISIFSSMNRVESLVVYSRLLTTFLIFINVSILALRNTNLIKFLAVIISIFLTIQSLQIIRQFGQGVQESILLDSIISNIKINTGNKNILAASLAIKIPFVIFLIQISNTWWRTILGLVLCAATFSIALVNARASYISVALQLLLFISFYLFWAFHRRNFKKTIKTISWSVLPIALGVIFSNWIFAKIIELQETDSSTYNTVLSRVGGISFSSAGSSGRTILWQNTLDYIQRHPIIGAGYGNWKLASIPYERENIDELFVAYHSHNDFLEMAAETGWLGGLCYLSIFIVAGLGLFKLLIKIEEPKKRPVILLLLMVLASYFTDATFNFPIERPVMQCYLGILLAFIMNSLNYRMGSNPFLKSNLILRFFFPSSLLLLLVSGYFNIKVYESMLGQMRINTDMLSTAPSMSYEEVEKKLPNIPNLNAFCFPIGVIKSRYLINEKKYKNAIDLLEQCRNHAPQFSINEFYTAQAYRGLERFDSALWWTKKAFEFRPRATNNYTLLNQLLTEIKDSTALDVAFKEIRMYRNEPWIWKTHIVSLMYSGASSHKINKLIDSAVALFPANSELQNLSKSLSFEKAKSSLDAATLAFKRGDFNQAVLQFIKTSELNPYDYSNFENVGMSYYAKKDFENAIVWFDKVIKMSSTADTKSVFFKAQSLKALGKIPEACKVIEAAIRNNYPGALDFKKSNCQH